MFSIYKLISPSNSFYIGLTSKPIEKRFNQHVNSWKNKKKGCEKLYSAFDKYAPKLWRIEVLSTTDDKEVAESIEIFYIKYFNTIKNGYNILPGGKINRIGIKSSRETISKQLGKPLPEATKKNMRKAHLGKKHSQETINKMRGKTPWNKGKKLSDEHRKIISSSLLGNKRSVGRIVSEETRKKLSLSISKGKIGKKGHAHTEEYKQKLRERMMGNSYTLGNKLSEEHKQKISQGLKNRYAIT